MSYIRSLSVVACAALVLIASSAHAAQVVSLSATDDNFVEGGADANTTFNPVSTQMLVKGNTNEDVARKSYVQFSLTGLSALPNLGGTFRINVIDSINDSGGGTGTLVDVFALNAGAPGFNWDESTITWNNAPANINDGAQQFNANATKVGSFFALYDESNGPEFPVFIPDLTPFIQADDTISILMSAGRNTSGTLLQNRRALLATNTNTSLPGPILELSVIPEPTSAAALCAGGLALLARRRRRAAA